MSKNPQAEGTVQSDEKKDATMAEAIRRDGDKWTIYAKDGKTKLASFDDKEKAQAVLAKIEAKKAVKAKAKTGEGFIPLPTESEYILLAETIKHEGSKWVIYNKDGSKKLGSYGSEAEAKKRLGQIEFFKNKTGESLGWGLGRDEQSHVVVVEGGQYFLNEDADDLPRMEDEDLQDLRKTFVEKRTALRAAQAAMDPEDRYGSPEGSALFDDLCYYNALISRIECEMACRLLPLDGDAPPDND